MRVPCRPEGADLGAHEINHLRAAIRNPRTANLSLLGEGDHPKGGGVGGSVGQGRPDLQRATSSHRASLTTMLRMVPLSQLGEEIP